MLRDLESQPLVDTKQEDGAKEERGIKRERDGDRDDEADEPICPAQSRRRAVKVEIDHIGD